MTKKSNESVLIFIVVGLLLSLILFLPNESIDDDSSSELREEDNNITDIETESGVDSLSEFIVLSIDCKKLKGKNYEQVIEILSENGFENIKTVIIYDLITGWLVSDGEVENVYIDGDKNIKSGVKLDMNVEIIVEYHTFSSNAPVVKMPKNSDYYIESDFSVEQVKNLFKEIGFYNIELIEEKNPIGFQYDSIYKIKIEYDWSFSQGEEYAVNVPIEIHYCQPSTPLTIYNCEDLYNLVNGDFYISKFVEKYKGQVVQIEATVLRSAYSGSTFGAKAQSWLTLYTGENEDDDNGIQFMNIAYYSRILCGYDVGSKVLVTGTVLNETGLHLENIKVIKLEK